MTTLLSTVSPNLSFRNTSRPKTVAHAPSRSYSKCSLQWNTEKLGSVIQFVSAAPPTRDLSTCSSFLSPCLPCPLRSVELPGKFGFALTDLLWCRPSPPRSPPVPEKEERKKKKQRGEQKKRRRKREETKKNNHEKQR